MNELMIIFSIVAIGYLIGSINIFGIQLGSSGVLLVALVFGHFGLLVSPIVKNLGLVCFVTSVGFFAGPVFFQNFKSTAKAYITLGIFIIFIGAVICIGVINIFKIPTPLSIGMMTGALTSTPGLAAAIEATGDSAASVGYGIAYPFGVVGVVLFVQIVPKLLKINLKEESVKLYNTKEEKNEVKDNFKKLDEFGFLAFAIAIILGIFIGNITIPLPGGAKFSLGTSGGPLLAGLIMGHFKHIGNMSISVPKTTLVTMREFGLITFLLGAGTDAGQGFIEIVEQYGIQLFILGALMTLIPMLVGFVIAKRIFNLDILNNLGSICGGMTSTPALGTLISVSGTDAVAASYAATYPIALICVVIFSQFIGIFFG